MLISGAFAAVCADRPQAGVFTIVSVHRNFTYYRSVTIYRAIVTAPPHKCGIATAFFL